jgi:general stress protein 26
MPKGYGVPETDEGMLEWGWAVGQLESAPNYWFGTTRPDGRPHTMPAWAVWLDGTLYFEGSPRTKRARNLAENPAVVVHLESGDDVVILEGVAREVTDPARLAAIDQAYFTKYAVRLTDHPGEVAIYSVRPSRAFAWQEADFPASATRWRLGEER